MILCVKIHVRRNDEDLVTFSFCRQVPIFAVVLHAYAPSRNSHTAAVYIHYRHAAKRVSFVCSNTRKLFSHCANLQSAFELLI